MSIKSNLPYSVLSEEYYQEESRRGFSGAPMPELTVNKSERQIGNQFDIKKFNLNFELEDEKLSASDNKTLEDRIREDELKERQKYNNLKLPHQRNIGLIIIGIRETFYGILNEIFRLRNPISYVLNTPESLLGSSLMFLIIGFILLFTSNILI